MISHITKKITIGIAKILTKEIKVLELGLSARRDQFCRRLRRGNMNILYKINQMILLYQLAKIIC